MYKIPSNPVKDGFLSSIYIDRPSIGIILDSLSNNQIAYEVLTAIFKVLPSKIEYVLFSQDWNPPVLQPATGLFHTAELLSYKGNLIVTSISSLWDCLKLRTDKKILFYIYNPHEFEMYNEEQLKQLIRPDIILVTRSETHRSYLNKFNIACQVVPDFELVELTKIIQGK